MEELFLNKEHIARFNFMMDELSFTDLRDPYWRSLVKNAIDVRLQYF